MGLKKVVKKISKHVRSASFMKNALNVYTGGLYKLADVAINGGNARDWASATIGGATESLASMVAGREIGSYSTQAAIGVAGAVASPFTGGASLVASAALIGAYQGMNQYQDYQDQKKEMAKMKAAAENAAGTGHAVSGAEIGAVEDKAGNEAAKKKKAQLAAGYVAGRGGTNITSNLGGNSRLGAMSAA